MTRWCKYCNRPHPQEKMTPVKNKTGRIYGYRCEDCRLRKRNLEELHKNEREAADKRRASWRTTVFRDDA
jgi:hypothetical protein